MKNDKMYLGHIRDAIEKVEAYVDGYTFEQFLNDNKTYDAVIRELGIIGEAANRVSEAFQNEHAEIPWSDISGMRNRLIHDYLGIKPEIVWNTCLKDLPHVKSILDDL